MAIGEDKRLKQARKPGFGIGLLKGLGVTLKHLFKHNVVIQYPDEKQDLPARTRGVIALKEENCTVCMLCSRECPDWCIYIDSHKETLPPKREGGRPRKRNVLDRFAIDYALCMYCGICVEVCPYDALFWSREFEYSEYDIRELTHEKERLSDWMATVLPPPPLEEGAEIPGQQPRAAASAASAPAAAAAPAVETVAATGSTPATTTSSAAETRPQQAAVAPKEGSFTTTPERPLETVPEGERAAATDTSNLQPEPARGLKEETEARTGLESATTEGTEDVAVQPGATESAAPASQPETSPSADQAPPQAPDAVAKPETPAVEAAAPAAPSTETPAQAQQAVTEATVSVPHEAPRPTPLEQTEDPEAVYQQVLEEQRAKGASPQVAEARAKVARVKAERGIKRAAGSVPALEVAPQAQSEGRPTEPTPSGAPDAKDIQPDPGPVAASSSEQEQQAPSGSAQETLSESEAQQDRQAEAAATEQEAQQVLQPEAPAEPQQPAPAPEQPAPQVAEQEQRFESEQATADEAEPSEQAAVQATGETSDQEVSADQEKPRSQATGEDPEAVYERVLAEERDKGSAEAVAVARAKAARARAQRGMRRPRS